MAHPRYPFEVPFGCHQLLSYGKGIRRVEALDADGDLIANLHKVKDDSVAAGKKYRWDTEYHCEKYEFEDYLRPLPIEAEWGGDTKWLRQFTGKQGPYFKALDNEGKILARIYDAKSCAVSLPKQAKWCVEQPKSNQINVYDRKRKKIGSVYPEKDSPYALPENAEHLAILKNKIQVFDDSKNIILDIPHKRGETHAQLPLKRQQQPAVLKTSWIKPTHPLSFQPT